MYGGRVQGIEARLGMSVERWRDQKRQTDREMHTVRESRGLGRPGGERETDEGKKTENKRGRGGDRGRERRRGFLGGERREERECSPFYCTSVWRGTGLWDQVGRAG